MNFYGEYPDIPQVPEDVLLSCQEIIELPEREYPNRMKEHRGNYEGRHKIKRVNSELKQWLIANFPFEIWAYYSVYPLLIYPHVDMRSVGYNYFIDTGGEVDTVFYNKVPNVGNTKLWNSINPRNEKYSNDDESIPLQELHRIRFEPRRWVKLQTDIPHGTEGSLVRPRVHITLGAVDDMPTSNSPVADSVRDLVYNW